MFEGAGYRVGCESLQVYMRVCMGCIGDVHVSVYMYVLGIGLTYYAGTNYLTVFHMVY